MDEFRGHLSANLAGYGLGFWSFGGRKIKKAELRRLLSSNLEGIFNISHQDTYVHPLPEGSEISRSWN